MWRRVRGEGGSWGPRLLTGTIFYVFRHFSLHCSIRSQDERAVARLGTGSRDTVHDLAPDTAETRSQAFWRQVQLLAAGQGFENKRTAQHSLKAYYVSSTPFPVSSFPRPAW